MALGRSWLMTVSAVDAIRDVRLQACRRRCWCFFCFGLHIIYPHSLIRKERKEKGLIREIETGKEKREKRRSFGKSGNKLCGAKVIQEKEVVSCCRCRAREGTTEDSKGFGEVVPEVVVLVIVCDFGGFNGQKRRRSTNYYGIQQSSK